jgi:hypothetical protein
VTVKPRDVPDPTGALLTRPPARDRGRWSPRDDDGWGPATAVYSASAGTAAARPKQGGAGFYPGSGAPRARRPQDDGWSPAGPRPSREVRAARAADRRTAASIEALRSRKAYERGLPWWAALLVLVGITVVGKLIDSVGSIHGKTGFNVGIVIASVIAILAVKRSHMFPIVIAPPIVYSGAALVQLWVRSSGLHDKKVVLDAAANYLVYGFPAIAAATAAVLIIAGVRMISRK